MYGWCRLQWWCIVVTSSVGAGPAGQASTATWSLILSGVWTKPSHLHCSSPHCAGVMLHGHRDHGSWWSTITTTIQNYPVFIFWRIIEIVIWTLWPSVGFLFWPKDYCRMRWQQLLKPSLIHHHHYFHSYQAPPSSHTRRRQVAKISGSKSWFVGRNE